MYLEDSVIISNKFQNNLRIPSRIAKMIKRLNWKKLIEAHNLQQSYKLFGVQSRINNTSGNLKLSHTCMHVKVSAILKINDKLFCF